MNGRIFATSFTGAILTLALLAAGCGETIQDSDESSDQEAAESSSTDDDVRTLPNGAKIKDGLHLRPGIEVIKFPMEVATGFEIDRGTSTITLTDKAAEAARNQQADRGDVVAAVNGPEKPVLVRIEEMNHTGDAIYIETSPFVFEQVFWGEWDYDVPLRLREAVRKGVRENDNLRVVPDNPYRTEHQKLLGIPSLTLVIGGEDGACASAPFGNEVEEAEEDADDEDTESDDSLLDDAGAKLEGCMITTLSFPPGNNTLDFRGKLPNFTSPDGHSCSNPQFDHWWSPKTYCVSYLEMRTELNIRPEFKLLARATGNFTPVDAEGVIWEQGLGQYPIGTTGLAIAPQFNLGWEAGAGAEGEAEIWTSAAGTLQIPAGFEYSNVGGRTGPIPHPGDPVQVVNTATQAGTQYSAGIYAEIALVSSLELQLEISGLPDVFEVTGPHLDGRVSARADYQPISSPRPDWGCTKAEIGADLSLGAEVSAQINKPFNWTLFTALEFNKQLWAETFFRWTGNGDYCPDGDNHGEDDYDPDEFEPRDSPPGRDAKPAFKIEVVWEQDDSDVDLFVNPPNTSQLAPGDSNAGWTHPFDVCEESCDPNGEHAEAAIYHPADAAPSGNYRFWLENNSGGPTDVTLNVRRGEDVLESWELTVSGQSKTFSGNYDPSP